MGSSRWPPHASEASCGGDRVAVATIEPMALPMDVPGSVLSLLAVSDLHDHDPSLLVKAVRDVSPDVVVFAGDGLRNCIARSGERWLTDLASDAKYGVLAVAGNADGESRHFSRLRASAISACASSISVAMVCSPGSCLVSFPQCRNGHPHVSPSTSARSRSRSSGGNCSALQWANILSNASRASCTSCWQRLRASSSSFCAFLYAS